MSIEFVRSQVEYYRRNLRRGHPRDWNMIVGLFQYYEQELQRLEDSTRNPD
ncbi:hypothetical protein IVB12_15425 [Bradyrhizobium sp. 179]|uniref:hypothetical protein n=1 Tax=Bradyrhizobium sp. 179 TaxID=2782648 RepID=UPI001FFAE264|nr:hypothetical protein [Bradyrhizobium sp. 179]MCK1543305.1 hypothetical protein [Bradyrhizobium sp. 179]